MAAHSNRGMSGQSIIMACPGSVEQSDGIEEEEHPLAKMGSAVHDMGEFAFHLGVDAIDLVGMKFRQVKATKAMSESAQVYIDQLRKLAKPVTVKPMVEKRVWLSSIDKERLWGTGDFIGIDLINRTLYIADYKNGYVSVEINKEQYVHALGKTIKGNAQCVGYGLGALDTYYLWDKVDRVITTIIQPNKPHVDGPIRTVTYTIDEMRMWQDAYRKSHEMSIKPGAPRIAGNWCKYCKGRATCSVRLVDMMDKLKLNTSYAHANPDQLIAIFNEADMMISTLKAIKQEVQELARKGYKVPDHKLVKAWKRAVVNDEDLLVNEALEKGKTKEELYNLSLKSKTDIVGILGRNFADKHFKTPDAGLKLVSLSEPGTALRPDKSNDATGIFSKVP